jgi:hypothetical protein
MCRCRRRVSLSRCCGAPCLARPFFRLISSTFLFCRWVEHGEQSMAFRLASWRDQRAAQDDLKIATGKDSSFMAFVSGKAITNRKNFAKNMKDAISITDFSDVRFLQAIFELANQMHSPCLRLELLQYVLGLDNRYSVAHVKRSVELAATCLSITQ